MVAVEQLDIMNRPQGLILKKRKILITQKVFLFLCEKPKPKRSNIFNAYENVFARL